ncbi:hypothetical protein GCM10009809_08240 [Isoptericola hypogeus]|uniref:Uncharacterized protein n=1 Tax=Isoptericola hypogeus TaxID=300179 RepID=A0ABP4UYJ3_9MICO
MTPHIDQAHTTRLTTQEVRAQRVREARARQRDAERARGRVGGAGLADAISTQAEARDDELAELAAAAELVVEGRELEDPRLAARRRTEENGRLFSEALDAAGAFGPSSALALQRDLTTDDTTNKEK